MRCDIEVALTYKHLPWNIDNHTFKALNNLLYKDKLITHLSQGFDYVRNHINEFGIIEND